MDIRKPPLNIFQENGTLLRVLSLGKSGFRISPKNRKSENGFWLIEIFLRGGFQLRKPNLDFMDLSFCVFGGKSEKGFAKKDLFAWAAVYDPPTVSALSWMAKEHWIMRSSRKNSDPGSRSLKYVEFSHFALLFCRRRQIICFRPLIAFAVAVCKTFLLNCMRTIGNWRVIDRCLRKQLCKSFSGFSKKRKNSKFMKSKSEIECTLVAFLR